MSIDIYNVVGPTTKTGVYEHYGHVVCLNAAIARNKRTTGCSSKQGRVKQR